MVRIVVVVVVMVVVVFFGEVVVEFVAELNSCNST